ncbi:potassium channel family protein [Streptomyces sp. ACA25]|uniref:potassium channel family protein n=1 Tax=Streptomyces sp. ACA25 TaxID=3022596 RepID=UPI00230808B3|nr:potassium channel family protein [Streptomyces sp. ACA25]MDB1088121.1 potassium channel family protein [Streptomyces sp. ACA25]
MHWWISVVGAGLILLALRDIFHTLWHPFGHGALSERVIRVIWRMFRRIDARGKLIGTAGPAGTVLVIVLWTVLLVLGWALVYWPFLPGAFSFDPGLNPSERLDALDALYLSLVVVATLGFGDIVPDDAWLRAVTPLQALIGFALLSASVSWVSQITPALQRRRTLAARLAALRTAGADGQLARLDSPAAATMLDSLTTAVLQVRVDLSQYSETYYFHDGPDSASLASVLGYAADLAEQGQESPRADVRLASAVLNEALDDLGGVLDQYFLHSGAPTREVFTAYAADHGRRP